MGETPKKKNPSLPELEKFICVMNRIVFPEIFGESDAETDILKAEYLLTGQIGRKKTREFIDRIPEIIRLLGTDVEAVSQNDPAVTSKTEVILCYPAIKEMLHYRVAHELLKIGVPLVPRMLTEMAHSATGIDIHPAASIGEYFGIDHGTGVVIGETSIIGNHVMLYQGVTLGAKNFRYDGQGRPMDVPRHPILEDNVTVYSNTSILGRVTIGHDTIIGGNVWLTHNVPPFSRILQSCAIEQPLFGEGSGI